MRTLLTAALLVALSGCPSNGTGTGGGGGSTTGGGGGSSNGGGGGGAQGGGTGGASGGGTGGSLGGGTGGGTTGGGTGGSTGAGPVTFDTFAFYKPVLVSGADGVLHMVFNTNNSPSTIQYARCASACGIGSNWTVAILATEEFTGATRLVIGTDNRLHLLYDVSHSAGAEELIYATCASNCTQPASWTKTNLASLFGGAWDSPSNGTPLVIDSQNRLSFTVDRMIYTNGGLTLATCASNCSTLASWTAGVIRATGTRTALAAQGTTLHQLVDNATASTNGTTLAYRTCASNCTQQASWQELPNLFVYDGAQPLSMAVTAQGVVHVAYNQGLSDASQPANIKAQDNKLLIWGCTSNCTTLSSWSGFITGAAGDGSEGIAMAEQLGSLVISISNSDRVFARYCGSNCLSEASWQSGDLDTAASVTADYNPYTLMQASCSGVAPQSATWHLAQGVVAIRPDGSAAFAHAASILRICPGSSSVVYVPGYGRFVFVP
jgi:hypothetical protein